MIPYICMAVNCCILAYGGYIDYKRREIPNSVPIVLMLTGLISAPHLILFRLVGLAMIASSFILAAKLTSRETPGGDFKLLSALAFSAGVPTVLIVLMLSGLIAVTVGLIRKKDAVKRHIPLCSYVAPAYFTAELIFLSIFGLFQ